MVKVRGVGAKSRGVGSVNVMNTKEEGNSNKAMRGTDISNRNPKFLNETMAS